MVKPTIITTEFEDGAMLLTYDTEAQTSSYEESRWVYEVNGDIALVGKDSPKALAGLAADVQGVNNVLEAVEERVASDDYPDEIIIGTESGLFHVNEGGYEKRNRVVIGNKNEEVMDELGQYDTKSSSGQGALIYGMMTIGRVYEELEPNYASAICVDTETGYSELGADMIDSSASQMNSFSRDEETGEIG